MGMVDGHLVDPTELGERGVEEIEAPAGAGPPGVGVTGSGTLTFCQDGLQALPVRERAQTVVSGEQIVEVGGSGAGQAADDDRGGDFLVPDLRMTSQQDLDKRSSTDRVASSNRDSTRSSTAIGGGRTPSLVIGCMPPAPCGPPAGPAAR